jgi:hypothetical protein
MLTSPMGQQRLLEVRELRHRLASPCLRWLADPPLTVSEKVFRALLVGPHGSRLLPARSLCRAEHRRDFRLSADEKNAPSAVPAPSPDLPSPECAAPAIAPHQARQTATNPSPPAAKPAPNAACRYR